MERRRNGTKSSRTRQRRKSENLTFGTMADAELLNEVQSRGVRLHETGIQVLGLSGYDLKRLGDAGIFSLEQLANCLVTDILNIPHFGVMKVRRMKAGLELYLNSHLAGDSPEAKPLPRRADNSPGSPPKNGQKAAAPGANRDPQPELEAFSKSLERLERRVKSLKSRLARARKEQLKNNKVPA